MGVAKTDVDRPAQDDGQTAVPRLALMDPATIDDPELHAIFERAKRLTTPRPEWFQVAAANPALAKVWSAYWEATFREGQVEHRTKELMRLTIVALLDCAHCSTQRSVVALEAGMSEELVAAAALPDADGLDYRQRVACRYGRALVLNDPTTEPQIFDSVYEELREAFSDAEIVELVCLAMMCIGGAWVARGLNLPTGPLPVSA